MLPRLYSEKPRRISESVPLEWSFAFHASMAMIAASVLVAALFVAADYALQHASPHLKSVIEGGGLLNPLIWIPGITLGFLTNRLIPRGAACWVWIVGALWLASGVWDSIYHNDVRYYQGCSALQNTVNAFFILNARRCGGGESTLSGLVFTTPAISSVVMRLDRGSLCDYGSNNRFKSSVRGGWPILSPQLPRLPRTCRGLATGRDFDRGSRTSE